MKIKFGFITLGLLLQELLAFAKIQFPGFFSAAFSMLITLPRGYEKCPFGSLLSFIHIMYFHIHGIRSRVEQGAP